MKMSTKQATLIHVNEDYIDMELTCSSPFSSSSCCSSQSREFEFQMTSSLQNEKDSTTSPADDLFYKGKLLPLHLPPRLKMVQNLIIENNNNNNVPDTSYLCSKNATLFDSVKSFSSLEDSNFPSLVESLSNISPSESCRVSSDNANPDEYFFCNWSSSSATTSSDIHHNNNASSFVSTVGGDFPNKSWPKKMKMLKQLLVFQRLKSSSRTYLKSLFNKSGFSDKSCANASSTNIIGTEKEKMMMMKKKKKKNDPFEFFDDDDDGGDCDDSNNNNNNNKKKKQLLSSCGVMKSLKREIIVEDNDISNHRRSFSGVVQRHCANNKAFSMSTSSCSSSSSSSSSSSGGYYDLQIFKRSISANNSEMECSVEGAIAHCKNSQKLYGDSKNTSSSRICSQFASKVAVSGNQDMASAFASNRG